MALDKFKNFLGIGKEDPSFQPSLFDRIKPSVSDSKLFPLSRSSNVSITTKVNSALQEFDQWNTDYSPSLLTTPPPAVSPSSPGGKFRKDNPHLSKDLKSLVSITQYLLTNEAKVAPTAQQFADEWPLALWLTLKLAQYKEYIKEEGKEEAFVVLVAASQMQDALTEALKFGLLSPETPLRFPSLPSIVGKRLKELTGDRFKDIFQRRRVNSAVSREDLFHLLVGVAAASDNLSQPDASLWTRFWEHYSQDLLGAKHSAATELVSWTLPFLQFIDGASCLTFGMIIVNCIGTRLKDNASCSKPGPLVFGVAGVFVDAVKTREPRTKVGAVVITTLVDAIGTIAQARGIMNKSKRCKKWISQAIEFADLIDPLQHSSGRKDRSEFRNKLCLPMLFKLGEEPDRLGKVLTECNSDANVKQHLGPLLEAFLAYKSGIYLSLQVVLQLPPTLNFQDQLLKYLATSPVKSILDLAPVVDRFSWGTTASKQLEPLRKVCTHSKRTVKDTLLFLLHCPNYCKRVAEAFPINDLKPIFFDIVNTSFAAHWLQQFIEDKSNLFSTLTSAESDSKTKPTSLAINFVGTIAVAAVDSLKNEDASKTIPKLLTFLPSGVRDRQVPAIIGWAFSRVAQLFTRLVAKQMVLPTDLSKLGLLREHKYVMLHFPDLHKIYLDSLDNFVHKLNGLFNNLDDFSEADLNWLQSSKKNIEFIQRSGMKVTYPADINKVIQETIEVRKKIEDTLALGEWLHRNNITAVNLPDEKFKDYSLNKLNALLDRFDIGELDDSVKEGVLFFVRHRSILFDAITRKKCQNVGTRHENVKAIVSAIVNEATSFLGRLIDEKQLRLGDFQEIAELQRTTSVKGLAYTKELEVVTEFFKKDSKSSDVSQQKKSTIASQLMETALEINEYRNLLSRDESALRAWRDMKLFPEESDKIQILLPELESQETSLERAKGILGEFKKIFGPHFKPFHLNIFERIGGEGREVISFLLEQQQTFQAVITRLTGELQTYQEGLSLLNNIIQVQDACKPLLEAIKQQRAGGKPPLIPVCDAIARNRTTMDSVQLLLNTIATVASRLAEIRVLFSLNSSLRLETLASYIDKLIKTGEYTSCGGLSSQGSALAFFYIEQNKRTPIDALVLQDLVLGMRVFVSKQEENSLIEKETTKAAAAAATSTEEGDEPKPSKKKSKDEAKAEVQQSAISVFLEVHDLAQEIHNIHLQLQQTGHPAYYDPDLAIGEPPLNVKQYQRIKQRLEDQKLEWVNALNTEIKTQPRLLFLDDRRLSHYVRQFRDLVLGSKAPLAAAAENPALIDCAAIMPFVLACFPEQFHRTLDRDGRDFVLSPHRVALIFKAELEDLQGAEENPAAWLAPAARFILSIESHPDVKQKRSVRKAEDITVVKALTRDGFDSTTLFQLIFELNGQTVPHPSHVIWCSSTSAERDLVNFVDRARLFGDFPDFFYIVGINFLPIGIRRKLLRHLADLHADRNRETIPLYLIFTEPTGMDVYSWLPQHQRQPKQLTALSRDSRLTESTKKIRTEKLEVIQGPFGSGKSYMIRNRIKDLIATKKLPEGCHKVISINEDWRVSSFIHTYRQLVRDFLAKVPEEQQAIAFHFNVSAYSNYKLVNTFFYNLIYFGLVWDDATGLFEYIPRTLRWYLFIELSSAPNEDDDFKTLSSDEHVFSALPALRFSAQRVKDRNEPLELENEHWRRSLAVAKLWIGGQCNVTHTQPYLNLQPLAKEEASQVLRQLLEFLRVQHNVAVPSLNLNLSFFLDLLTLRCDWLVTTALIHHGFGTEVMVNQDDLPLLVTRFFIEAATWSQQNVVLNEATKQPISSRHFIPPHDDNPGLSNVNFIPARGDSTPDWLRAFPVERRLDYHKLMSTPSHLRGETANGLGFHNTSDFAVAIAQQKFVLTPELAYKLHLLHERCSSKRNLIMSGATGVGKTHLFEFYAAARNVSASLMLVWTVLDRVMKGILQPKIAAAPADSDAKKALTSAFDKIAPLRQAYRERPEQSQAAFLEAIKELCGEPDFEAQPAPAVPAGEEGEMQEPGTFFSYVSNRLVAEVGAILESFPLLIGSSHIDRLKECYAAMKAGQLQHQNIAHSVDQLCDVITSVLQARFAAIFHRILMHPGKTAGEFKAEIRKIEEDALQIKDKIARRQRELQAQGATLTVSSPTVVVFIDEYNTTSVMGLVKEVMCDGSLEGVPLDSSLFFIAAMNPKKDKPIGAAGQIASSSVVRRIDYTGNFAVVDDDYIVRPPHESMNALVIDFGNFERWQERQFLSVMCDERHGLGSSEQRNSLRDIVHHCQDFVRCCALKNIKVSIRDTLRAMHLFAYFNDSKNKAGAILLNMDGVKPGIGQRGAVQHWRSVIMAVYLTYYTRLPAASTQTTKSDHLGIEESQVYLHLYDPDFTDKLMEALGESLANMVSTGRVDNSHESLGTLLFVLDCVFRRGRIRNDIPFVHLVRNTLAANGRVVRPELLAACDTVEAFGDDLSFRLWVITSLQAGSLVKQLESFFDFPQDKLYRPDAPYPGIGDQVVTLLRSNVEPANDKGTPQIVFEISFERALDLRKKFTESIDQFLLKAIASDSVQPSIVVGKQHYREQDGLISQVVADCTTALFKRATIPAGIAPTEALRSNFFAMVTCIDAKVPLTILGPAGCSKTLSYVLADDNMKAEQSTSQIFKQIKRLHTFRYQCSPYSTDAQVEAKFNAAIERQQMFEKGFGDEQCQEICCVMIDEAGLPPEEHHPLKVLHFHTDNPRVSSVIITNTILDAAKTNRTALVQLPAVPHAEDLRSLARAALWGRADGSKISEEEAIVQGLCRGFEQCSGENGNKYSSGTKRGLYQQRDFVYFLRSIRSRCVDSFDDHKLYLKPKHVLEALRRNFGGISTEAFNELCQMFFNQINESLRGLPQAKQWELPQNYEKDSTIETLLESLDDKATDNSNSSIAPWRYIALLDPTDSEAAVSLLMRILQAQNKNYKIQICAVSDFQGDANDSTRSGVIAKIREAMASGEIVLFINSGPIRTNFYDVFNRYFSRTMGKETFEDYANVAVGTQSRPCAVHPDFKFIVHIPTFELPTCPLPFLDRFEKYLLSVQGLLKGELERLPRELRITSAPPAQASGFSSTPSSPSSSSLSTLVSHFDVVYDGIKDMVTRLHDNTCNGRLLCNIEPGETVASLMLDILDRSRTAHSKYPVVYGPLENARTEEPQMVDDPNSFMNDQEDDADEMFTNYDNAQEEEAQRLQQSNLLQSVTIQESVDKGRHRRWIRQANLRLLQLGRPESLFNCRILPSAYAISYILNQEHFNLMRFMQHAIVDALGAPATSDEDPADLSGSDSDEDAPKALKKPEPVPVDSIDSTASHTARKWCIYSRACGQLLQVDTSPQIRQFLNNWLQDHVVKDRPHLRNATLETLTLGESRSLSSAECDKAVADFAAKCSPARPGILLCIADMQTTTRSQLNWLRNAIDNHVTSEYGIVFVVLHFPPELLFSLRTRYAPVYLNNWEFTYVDSFGMSDDFGNADKAVVPAASAAGAPAGSAVEEPVFAVPNSDLEHDTRAWIAWAFGIRISSVSPKSIRQAMKGTFLDILRHFCFNSSVPQLVRGMPARQGDANIFYSGFVKQTNNKPAEVAQFRFNFLARLFAENPWLLDRTVSRYAKAWTGSLVHSVVKQASVSIQAGQVVGSFVRVIQSALRQLMIPLVAQTFTQLIAYHNLCGVDRVITEERLRRKERPKGTSPSPEFSLIRILTDAVDMPEDLKDLDRITNSYNSSTLNLKWKPVRAILPFYQHIMDEVEHQIRVARRKARDELEKIKIVSEVLHPAKSAIGRAISYIDQNPALLRKFIEDFVNCTLNLNLEGPLMQLAATFVERLLGNTPGVIAVAMVKQLHNEKFILFQASSSAIKQALSELAHFDASSHIAQVNNADELTITSVTALITVDVLFAALKEAITTSNEGLFRSWSEAFRTLRAGVLSRRQLLSRLTATKAANFEAMSVIFIYMINYSTSIEESMTDIGHVATREALGHLNVDLFPGMNLVALIDAPDAMRLLRLAFGLIQANSDRLSAEDRKARATQLEDYAAYFLQDLFGLYFLDPLNEGGVDNNIPNYFMQSVKFFLSLASAGPAPAPAAPVAAAAGADQPLASPGLVPYGGAIEISPELREMLRESLPQAWRLKIFSHWLAHAPLQWRTEVLQCAASLIKQDAPQQGYNYRFDPCVLLESADAQLEANLAKLEKDVTVAREHLLPPATELEMFLYHIFLNEQQIHSTAKIYSLCEEYAKLSPAVDATVEERILATLHKAALAVAILQIAALQICNDARKPENVISNWPKDKEEVNVVDTIKTIFGAKDQTKIHSPDGFIRNAQSYFLSRLDGQHLVSLITSQEALKTLGLSNWFVKDPLSVPPMSQFSFTLDVQTPEAVVYKQLRDALLSNNLATVQRVATPTNEKHRYTLRMMLVLAMYHNYYAKTQPCAIYGQAKQAGTLAGLQFTADELRAVDFIAAGPADQPSPKDILGLFSRQARDPRNEFDTTLADLMVSCLAVALGCPSESTHLYTRIFRPMEMRTTSCPGSDYSRYNYDCGFQLQEKTFELTQMAQPAVMGNNKRCRTALASITWACWCWPLILNPNDALVAHWNSSSATHFLNGAETEITGPFNRTEKSRFYIMRRCTGFLNLLANDAEMVASQANSVHYVTESLLALWNAVHSGTAPAFKNTKTEQEAIAYENAMQGLFNAILANYPKLKDVYLGQAAFQVAISTVSQIQAKLGAKFDSPLIGFDLAKAQFIGELPFRLPFLEQYIRTLPSFKILKYIPRLVFFYDLLNKMFGHRLTKDDLRLPVLACLQKVKALEPQETYDRFLGFWKAFKKDWAELKEELQSLIPVCNDQAVNRAFESEVIEVSDTTPLLALVTESNAGESTDAITRVINSIAIQRDLLNLRGKTYSCVLCGKPQVVAYKGTCCDATYCKDCFDSDVYDHRDCCKKPCPKGQMKADPATSLAVARFQLDRKLHFNRGNRVGYAQLNVEERLFEGEIPAMPAQDLPTESDYICRRFFFGSDWTEQDCKTFVELHLSFSSANKATASLAKGVNRADLRVDFERIERQVLERSACKVDVDVQGLRKVFPVIDTDFMDVDAPVAASTAAAKPQTTSATGSPSASASTRQPQRVELNGLAPDAIVHHLEQLVTRMSTTSPFVKPYTEIEKRRLLERMRGSAEDSLLAVTTFFYNLLHFLNTNELGFDVKRYRRFVDGQHRIEDVYREMTQVNGMTAPAFRAMYPKFSHEKLVNLKELCLVVVRLYKEKSYLFPTGAELDQDPSPAARAILEELKARVMDAKAEKSADYRRGMELLLTELKDPVNLGIEQDTDLALREATRHVLQPETVGGNLPAIVLEDLMPEEIFVRNYAPYMRFLHILCGDLTKRGQEQAEAKLQKKTAAASAAGPSSTTLLAGSTLFGSVMGPTSPSTRSKVPQTNPDVYSEKIPAGLADTALEGNAAVPLPSEDKPSSMGASSANGTAPVTPTGALLAAAGATVDEVEKSWMETGANEADTNEPTALVADSTAAAQHVHSVPRNIMEIVAQVTPTLRLRSSPKGIPNTHNICFSNATIQCLLAIPPFRAFYLANGGPVRAKFEEMTQFAKAIWQKPEDSLYHLFDDESVPDRTALDMKLSLSRDFAEYRYENQFDSHEFLARLMDKKLDPVVNQLFEAKMEQNCKCLTQHAHSSITSIPQTSLSLELPTLEGSTSAPSMEKLIVSSMGLTAVNVKCSKCPSDIGQKQLFFASVPPVLVIHFKRFRQTPLGNVLKSEALADCPTSLVLPAQVLSPSLPKSTITNYTLVAATLHSGSLDQGHYYARLWANNKWYTANDLEIKQAIPERNWTSDKAYVLFYVRNDILDPTFGIPSATITAPPTPAAATSPAPTPAISAPTSPAPVATAAHMTPAPVAPTPVPVSGASNPGGPAASPPAVGFAPLSPAPLTASTLAANALRVSTLSESTLAVMAVLQMRRLKREDLVRLGHTFTAAQIEQIVPSNARRPISLKLPPSLAALRLVAPKFLKCDNDDKTNRFYVLHTANPSQLTELVDLNVITDLAVVVVIAVTDKELASIEQQKSGFTIRRLKVSDHKALHVDEARVQALIPDDQARTTLFLACPENTSMADFHRLASTATGVAIAKCLLALPHSLPDLDDLTLATQPGTVIIVLTDAEYQWVCDNAE